MHFINTKYTTFILSKRIYTITHKTLIKETVYYRLNDFYAKYFNRSYKFSIHKQSINNGTSMSLLLTRIFTDIHLCSYFRRIKYFNNMITITSDNDPGIKLFKELGLINKAPTIHIAEDDVCYNFSPNFSMPTHWIVFVRDLIEHELNMISDKTVHFYTKNNNINEYIEDDEYNEENISTQNNIYYDNNSSHDNCKFKIDDISLLLKRPLHTFSSVEKLSIDELKNVILSSFSVNFKNASIEIPSTNVHNYNKYSNTCVPFYPNEFQYEN